MPYNETYPPHHIKWGKLIGQELLNKELVNEPANTIKNCLNSGDLFCRSRKNMCSVNKNCTKPLLVQNLSRSLSNDAQIYFSILKNQIGKCKRIR
jgi:hypothetical protein